MAQGALYKIVETLTCDVAEAITSYFPLISSTEFLRFVFSRDGN